MRAANSSIARWPLAASQSSLAASPGMRLLPGLAGNSQVKPRLSPLEMSPTAAFQPFVGIAKPYKCEKIALANRRYRKPYPRPHWRRTVSTATLMA